jgi:hypothetical protein
MGKEAEMTEEISEEEAAILAEEAEAIMTNKKSAWLIAALLWWSLGNIDKYNECNTNADAC